MSTTSTTRSSWGRFLPATGRWRLIGASAGCLLAAGSLAACSGNDSMLVLTASSAQDAVREMAEDSPGRIGVASGGSNSLVRQLSSGAEADVLITADEETMAAASDAGLLASEPVTVATSRLVLVVPAEGSLNADSPIVTSLADLESSEIDLVLCSEPVPCGAAARAALDSAGLDPQVRSYEPNSRQTLSKVALGVADAALVWEVDARSEERVAVVTSADQMPVTRYQAAVVRGAQHSDQAEEFISRMESDEGQAFLVQFGFLPVDRRELSGAEPTAVGLS